MFGKLKYELLFCARCRVWFPFYARNMHVCKPPAPTAGEEK